MVKTDGDLEKLLKQLSRVGDLTAQVTSRKEDVTKLAELAKAVKEAEGMAGALKTAAMDAKAVRDAMPLVGEVREAAGLLGDVRLAAGVIKTLKVPQVDTSLLQRAEESTKALRAAVAAIPAIPEQPVSEAEESNEAKEPSGPVAFHIERDQRGRITSVKGGEYQFSLQYNGDRVTGIVAAEEAEDAS